MKSEQCGESAYRGHILILTDEERAHAVCKYKRACEKHRAYDAVGLGACPRAKYESGDENNGVARLENIVKLFCCVGRERLAGVCLRSGVEDLTYAVSAGVDVRKVDLSVELQVLAFLGQQRLVRDVVEEPA